MGGGGSTPQLKLPQAPSFTDPFTQGNLSQFGPGGDTYNTAVNTDTATIANTRKLWATLNPNLSNANKLFQKQTLDEVAGRDPNQPAIQNALLTSGLQGAAGAFGDTGTINTAATARNLGVGIADYAQNRRNEARGDLGFSMGLPINQPTQVGYTGKDALELALQEASLQNNFNTSQYQTQSGQATSALQGQISAGNQSSAQTGAAVGAGGAIIAALVVAL